jgi:hypothetical protein
MLNPTIVSTVLVSLTLASAGARADAFVPLKGGVSAIRKQLKEAGVTEEQSCLVDYLAREKQIVDRMALGTLGVPGVPVATGVGALGGGLIGALAAGSESGEAGLAAVGAGIVFGGVPIALAGTTTLVVGESVGLAHLLKTNALIETIYEAHVGEGKHIAKFIRDLRKHGHVDSGSLSDAQIRASIVAHDEDGSLCDGKLVAPKRYGKGKTLAQRLANAGELTDAIEKRN